jgi:hypothetical protein
VIVATKTAIIARLNTDRVLATCGHEGVVTDRPEQYWTLFIDSGKRGTDRLAGLPTQGRFRFWIHWVGRTPDQAQHLADRGMPLLAGHLLAVPGYDAKRVQHIDSQAVDLDSTVRPPVHFGVDQFAVQIDPA